MLDFDRVEGKQKMTFRLFNALSEFFKAHPTWEIYLRIYVDDGWHTIYSFGNDEYIENIENNIKEFPTAELFVFDGNFYTDFQY